MRSRWDIEHVTDISAPIELAWDHLVDIDHWDWNHWTRLEAEEVKTGVKGKLTAPVNGDDQKWETLDFEFESVRSDDHVMAWFGKVGPGGCLFRGTHTMKLKKTSEKTTQLIHTEAFGGLLPMLGLGLPYKKLNENYLKINMAFKDYVEAKANA